MTACRKLDWMESTWFLVLVAFQSRGEGNLPDGTDVDRSGGEREIGSWERFGRGGRVSKAIWNKVVPGKTLI